MNTMNTKKTGDTERFGRLLGRIWRGYVGRERQITGWLVTRSVPAGVATALLWIIKLVVLGGLLYVAFWLALLLMFAIVVAWSAHNTDPDKDQEPEWKMGLSGYGLYRGDTRIDPDVPDDD